jgi:hypothetical protein
VDWIQLTQDTDQGGGPYEHGNESLGSIQGGEYLE